MRELRIRTSHSSYAVRVGSGLARELAADSDAAIIDRRIRPLLPGVDPQRSIWVDGNEETKTLAGCGLIVGEMHRIGVRRGDRLAAFGGGSVQDVATFVASVYMRGIAWRYAPSTAMSMLDSCVGGKSSINVGGIKNLIGGIHPPTDVAIDTSLITGLDVEARINGLAEAVKICFARGRSEFERFLDLNVTAEALGDNQSTQVLIHHVLAAKQWFIEVDEHDLKERQLLNFGHTYAHALEAATGFGVPHGVAVAIGVLAATRHPRSESDASTEALRAYCVDLLSPLVIRLAAVASRVDWEVFERAIFSDKKGTRDAIRLVLPSPHGGVAMVKIPRDERSLADIRTSLTQALEELSR